MKNKTFKGTRGPWFYYYDPLDSVSLGGSFRVKADDAASTPVGNLPNPSGFYSQKQEANARLIAAAPELLEALNRLVDLIDSEGEGLECGMPTPQQWYDARNKAEAAIDKALGNE